MGVLVTAAGVVVALYYARLTRRLARTAREQSETTRKMFEAGHRPYLKPVFPFQELHYFRREDYNFSFSLHNHGAVPALLVGWRMDVTLDGEKGLAVPTSGGDIAVFPGPSGLFVNSQRSGSPLGQQPQGELRLDLVVEYRSLSDEPTLYWTHVIATRNAKEWVYTTKAR
jgi:hypothetical protein